MAVYHNADAESLPESIVERILDGTVDWITLTSSAITERLHELLPEPARRRIGREVRLASLSPVTSATAARLGWSVAVEATEFTWDGLVDALVKQIAADRRRTLEPPRLSRRRDCRPGVPRPGQAIADGALAEFQNRLDPLPQEERRPQDKQNVHGDAAGRRSRRSGRAKRSSKQSRLLRSPSR